ncbi:MAG: CGNR zinc finger domain-containing protein [Actinomycetota bacterium]|nr:CGNR zinc finger domain-containing protein [Actinomycetota bacterium]
MLFTHDTHVALLATAALVNTASEASHSGADELCELADLERYVQAYEFTGSRTRDERELDAVRAARSRLRELWTLDERQAVERVNALLREFNALPQLVRHDAWDWHIHAVGPQARLADRICVEAAMAVLDLIRGQELSRLRTCAADDCEAVLVDLSRNRSKRFCDVGNCGNRANVAAYRARKAAGSP